MTAAFPRAFTLVLRVALMLELYNIACPMLWPSVRNPVQGPTIAASPRDFPSGAALLVVASQVLKAT